MYIKYTILTHIGTAHAGRPTLFTHADAATSRNSQEPNTVKGVAVPRLDGYKMLRHRAHLVAKPYHIKMFVVMYNIIGAPCWHLTLHLLIGLMEAVHVIQSCISYQNHCELMMTATSRCI